MAEKEYQRLTRARPRSQFAVVSSGNSSLWLGKDHVLCIDTTGYNESYKRFYFRGIQAFLIRKTARHKWVALVLAVLTLAFSLPAALSSEPTIKYIFGGIAGMFFMAFVINLALGPACYCHIRTAVQQEQLPSLNRLRRARKVLDRVRPHIAAAQGELKPEEIPLRYQQIATGATPSATMVIPAAIDDPNAPPRIS